jgi:hypothetical protein
VVVYVSADGWREIQGAGFEPKTWVRAVVKRELLKIGLEVPERVGHTASVGEVHRPAARSGCTYDTPVGTKCKVCGKVH